jgi:hypothetical protein
MARRFVQLETQPRLVQHRRKGRPLRPLGSLPAPLLEPFQSRNVLLLPRPQAVAVRPGA